MPCRNDGAAEQHAGRLKARLDEVTKLLCRACKLAEQGKVATDNAAIAAWWREHLQEDRQRILAEREAREAARRVKRERLARLRAEIALLEAETTHGDD